jgi:hypothetical protein
VYTVVKTLIASKILWVVVWKGGVVFAGFLRRSDYKSGNKQMFLTDIKQHSQTFALVDMYAPQA